MLDFRPISLDDKNKIQEITYSFAPNDCEFAFHNLFCWQNIQHTHFTIINDCLVLRFKVQDQYVFTLPIGKSITDIANTINLLCKETAEIHQTLQIQGEITTLKNILEQSSFAGKFTYTIHRNFFDYIYLRKDLVELKGHSYQPKRNHINKLSRDFNYKYVELTPAILQECIDLEELWRKQHTEQEQESYGNEQIVIETALKNYIQLNLQGGAIIINDKIEAFTFGAPINSNTFDIMIEKANIEYKGIYSVINHEFAKRIDEKFIYINREEDLGISGLRQSKMSYNPYILFEKAIAEQLLP